MRAWLYLLSQSLVPWKGVWHNTKMMSRWIRFLLVMLLGAVGGLFYGWGINPVQYVPPDRVSTQGAPRDRWLTQSEGRRGDWRREGEHRRKGDLVFGSTPSESLMLFCKTHTEAEHARCETGLEAVAMLR